MKNKGIRQNKGITLIALVITIIVILILAGVSINTLFGDNGLLTKADDARIANEKAEIKDRIATEVLASYDNDGTLNPTTLRNNLKARGGKVDDGTGFDVTVEMRNYTFYIDKDGNISEEKKTKGLAATDIAEQLSDTDGNSVIGKQVTGLTGGTLSKEYFWQIFYADSKNIYLIASDYINVDDAPYKTEGNKIYDNGDGYNLSMNNVIKDYPNGVQDIDTGNEDLNTELRNLNSEFNNEETKVKTVNPNMQAVAYMLDSSIWKPKFVGENNNNVKYVIGGPTIKQLFTSYNAKYSTNYEPKNGETYISNSRACDSYGYRIKKDDSWETSISNMLNSNDETYCCTWPMWVASPSAEDNYYLFDVNKIGSFYSDAYDYTGNVFRPLVCLSSNVRLEQTNKGYKIVDGN